MESERKSRYELFLEEDARKAQPTKRCPKCKKDKALDDFWRDRSATSGRMSHCKECINKTYKRKYKSREDRFWKTYHAKTARVGECIEWVGGYANKVPACAWDGKKNASVRRIVYRLAIGELPDDMLITPVCKNVRCVRQSHLKRITRDVAIANLHNSSLSGPDHQFYGIVPTGFLEHSGSRVLFRQGERHHNAKLTSVDIPIIRKLREDGVSLRKIAKRFGVSGPTIVAVVYGRTWAHIQ